MRRAEETDGPDGGLINWPDSSRLSAFSKAERLHNGHLGNKREVAVVGWFKQESMYGLSAKTSGRCREVGDLWRGGRQWRFECHHNC